MNNKMKYTLFALLVVGIVMLTSLTTVFVVKIIDKNNGAKIEANKEEMQSAADELKAIMEDENASMEEIERAFMKNIPKLEKETATAFIDSLAYLTHYNISIIGELNDAELALIYQSLDQDGVYNPELMIDESLKEKLGAVIDNHAIVTSVNGEIIVSVDYGYFNDTYGKYMADDYKAIFEFYEKEQKEDYLNRETNELFCDVVLDRISTLNALITKYPNSGLKEVYKSTKDFYMKEYLGLYSVECVYDENLKLKDYIIQSYKQVANDKESPIKEQMGKILTAYEKNNYVRNADVEALILTATNTTQSEYENIKNQLSE